MLTMIKLGVSTDLEELEFCSKVFGFYTEMMMVVTMRIVTMTRH